MQPHPAWPPAQEPGDFSRAYCYVTLTNSAASESINDSPVKPVEIMFVQKKRRQARTKYQKVFCFFSSEKKVLLS
jgi:hypothetical protein